MKTRGDLRQSVYQGAVTRIRPKLITIGAILAGLLLSPMIAALAMSLRFRIGGKRFAPAKCRPLKMFGAGCWTMSVGCRVWDTEYHNHRDFSRRVCVDFKNIAYSSVPEIVWAYYKLRQAVRFGQW